MHVRDIIFGITIFLELSSQEHAKITLCAMTALKKYVVSVTDVNSVVYTMHT